MWRSLSSSSVLDLPCSLLLHSSLQLVGSSVLPPRSLLLHSSPRLAASSVLPHSLLLHSSPQLVASSVLPRSRRCFRARDLPKAVQAAYHLIPYFIFYPQEGEKNAAASGSIEPAGCKDTIALKMEGKNNSITEALSGAAFPRETGFILFEV